MQKDKVTRRSFLKNSGLAAAGAVLASQVSSPQVSQAVAQEAVSDASVPAILGGPKSHTTGWKGWPEWDAEKFNPHINAVMNGRSWSRGGKVSEFEKKWAEMNGSKHCLTTVNGTNEVGYRARSYATKVVSFPLYAENNTAANCHEPAYT